MRSGGSLLVLVFALGGYFNGHLHRSNIQGIGAATAYLLLMNSPLLRLLGKAKSKATVVLIAIAINAMDNRRLQRRDLFHGRAGRPVAHPICVVLTIYVGVWGPARQPIIKNGPLDWLKNSVKAIRDPSGAVAGTHGVSRGISERKAAEKEHLELQRKLMQAEKVESMGCMTGAVAHHFNNLLSGVMGNLELALDGLASLPGSGTTSKRQSDARAGRRSSAGWRPEAAGYETSQALAGQIAERGDVFLQKPFLRCDMIDAIAKAVARQAAV